MYVIETMIDYNLMSFSDQADPLSKAGVPGIVGLSIALGILLFLLCFMFRLFNKKTRTRGYGNANIPPSIILEGESPRFSYILP